MNMGENDGAIISHTLIKRIPVNYESGTAIEYEGKMLFSTGRTVRDNDMKVFLTVLKAYTDNRHDILREIKESKPLTGAVSTKAASFTISVAEVSNAIYKRGGRGTRLIESLERMSEMKIHLLDGKGNKMGFVSLVTGAILSKDRKTIEIGMNQSFLEDMAKTMLQYNFPKMLELQGINFRLYIAMQQHKYHKGKGIYGYTYVDHHELCRTLNLRDRNAKAKIAEAFQNIDINYKLRGDGKWFYPKKELPTGKEMKSGQVDDKHGQVDDKHGQVDDNYPL